MELVIVHRDRHLLVVDKPPGIATTAPDGRDCLTRRAEAAVGQKLHPSSRLDAEVSGLVTFARTKAAIAGLRRARGEGRYERVYVALVREAPDPAEGEWDWSIAIDPRNRTLRRAVAPGARGQRVQAARTRYGLRERGALANELELRPFTGRTHQLRVHAARAGHPLLGDVRYGGERRIVRADGRVVTAKRVMLHCERLGLPAIEGEETLRLERAPPEDFHGVWSALRA